MEFVVFFFFFFNEAVLSQTFLWAVGGLAETPCRWRVNGPPAELVIVSFQLYYISSWIDKALISLTISETKNEMRMHIRFARTCNIFRVSGVIVRMPYLRSQKVRWANSICFFAPSYRKCRGASCVKPKLIENFNRKSWSNVSPKLFACMGFL